MTRNLLGAILYLAIVSAPGTASAGFFKKVIKAAENVGGGVVRTGKKAGEIAVAPITVPVSVATTTVKVVTGDKSLKEGLQDSAKAVAAPHVAVVEVTAEGARTIADGHQVVANLAVSGAEKVAGEPGRVIAEIATAPQRLQVEVPATAVAFTGEVVTGEAPPADLVGVPLAGVINSAHAQYERIAQPLPDHVKAMLRGHFPEEVLESARYAIGEADLSLPAAINGSQRLFGSAPQGHAVTLDNIIVFSREPGNNYGWWAHELHHVVQYREWGVTGFARRYTLQWNDVESAAEAKEAEVAKALGLVK